MQHSERALLTDYCDISRSSREPNTMTQSLGRTFVPSLRSLFISLFFLSHFSFSLCLLWFLSSLSVSSTKENFNTHTNLQFFGLSVAEIQEDLDSFKNFNEFFYRKLKPEARPIHSPDDPVSTFFFLSFLSLFFLFLVSLFLFYFIFFNRR